MRRTGLQQHGVFAYYFEEVDPTPPADWDPVSRTRTVSPYDFVFEWREQHFGMPLKPERLQSLYGPPPVGYFPQKEKWMRSGQFRTTVVDAPYVDREGVKRWAGDE